MARSGESDWAWAARAPHATIAIPMTQTGIEATFRQRVGI
jgi:hypothetical protein